MDHFCRRCAAEEIVAAFALLHCVGTRQSAPKRRMVLLLSHSDRVAGSGPDASFWANAQVRCWPPAAGSRRSLCRRSDRGPGDAGPTEAIVRLSRHRRVGERSSPVPAAGPCFPALGSRPPWPDGRPRRACVNTEPASGEPRGGSACGPARNGFRARTWLLVVVIGGRFVEGRDRGAVPACGTAVGLAGTAADTPWP